MFRKPYIVVIRQLGGIGDVLTLSCVFRGLKEKYPKHSIKVITSAFYLSGCLLDIMEHNPLVDEIFDISPYDGATDETKASWTQFSAAPRLENEIVYKKAAMTFDLNVACINGEQAEIKQYGRVVTPRYKIWCDHAGVQPSSYQPIYEITEEEKVKADSIFRQRGWDGKRVVGIGVSAKDSKREASKAKLQAVCYGLRDLGYTPVTIDSLFQFPDVPGLVGKRVRDLMPLIAKMDLLISVDSGLLHMAGSVGTPVVGIFGTTDYRMRMGEYLGSAIDSSALVPCAPCWYVPKCLTSPNTGDHFKCMNVIGADVILEEARRWLENDLYTARVSKPTPKRLELAVLK